MEEEKPKVITATKVEKVKDPRRVALGRRRGAISREAKERKARGRQQQRQQQESETSSYLLLVPVVVIGAVAFGGYRYWLKDNIKEGEPIKEEDPIKKEDKRIPRLERL